MGRRLLRRVPPLAAVLCLGATVAATAGSSPGGTVAADAVSVSVLAEEFDGTEVEPTRWRTLHNTYGDGNNELACLQPANVTVAGGTARITARAETATCPGGKVRAFTSGFLSARDAGRWYPLLGRYEIRARVPHGQGVWPAFWLRHRNGASTAEVDVLEVFHAQRPGTAQHAVHVGGSRRSLAWVDLEPAVVGTGAWHTYAVDIRAASGGGIEFVFAIDGDETHRWTDPVAAWADDAPADATWDIAVNLAVGGNWIGHPQQQLGYLPNPDRCSRTLRAPDAGPESCPTDGIHLADLPALYEIDWIRVTAPGAAAPPPTTQPPTTQPPTTQPPTTQPPTTQPPTTQPPSRAPADDRTATERYVDALYLDLLGRAADGTGRSHWARQLDAGRPRWSVAVDLARSTEWTGHVVSSLYQDVLGRPPDTAGRAYWADRLGAGDRVASVAAFLLGSAESHARGGGTDAGWVALTHRILLDREPHPDELAWWTGLLRAGVGRDRIATVLWSAPEATGRRVDALYRVLLDRASEPGGRAWWATYLATNDDIVLAAQLVASDEYWTRTTGG
jgi:beta-glucanase (GH16 family)